MAAKRTRKTNGSGQEARARLFRRGQELREEGAALAGAARAAAADLADISRAQLERNPYLTLGSAFALGWVLGAGLPPRLMLAAARMGAMAAFDSVLSQSLAGPSGADEETEA